MAPALLSTSITEASSLLQPSPPLDATSILSASMVLVPFSYHRYPASHVPYETAWVKVMPPLCRAPRSQYAGLPLHSCRLAYHPPGFDAANRGNFRHFIQRFTFVHLLYPHLTCSMEGLFPVATSPLFNPCEHMEYAVDRSAPSGSRISNRVKAGSGFRPQKGGKGPW